jgi:tetratricopeptide repeat protein 21B
MLGGEVLEGVDTDVQMQAADSQDSQEMAMRTADKLLKELRPKPGEKTA